MWLWNVMEKTVPKWWTICFEECIWSNYSYSFRAGAFSNISLILSLYSVSETSWRLISLHEKCIPLSLWQEALQCASWNGVGGGTECLDMKGVRKRLCAIGQSLSIYIPSKPCLHSAHIQLQEYTSSKGATVPNSDTSHGPCIFKPPNSVFKKESLLFLSLLLWPNIHDWFLLCSWPWISVLLSPIHTGFSEETLLGSASR